MGRIGMTEIILILLVVVLLFGGRKIPELMKGLGQGLKDFKKASRVDDEPDNTKAESGEDDKSPEIHIVSGKNLLNYNKQVIESR